MNMLSTHKTITTICHSEKVGNMPCTKNLINSDMTAIFEPVANQAVTEIGAPS